MKENFVHVCFVIDESGSMYSSVDDVVGGFQKVIDEQKALKEGTCSISLYKFNDSVTEVYRGRDISEVKPLTKLYHDWRLFNFSSSITKNIEEISSDAVYSPGGSTAMYDGIGTAIDNIGKWLSDMDESQRPFKNLIIIMTDGMENASHKYKEKQIRDMIKEQEDKYNWSFIYMGTDITTTKYADSLGFKNQSYTTRDDYSDNYCCVNSITSSLRCCDAELASNADDFITKEMDAANTKYFKKTGINLSKKDIEEI